MRRIALLLLLAWLGFFVGWPAWCGYRIKTAIENEEPSVLEDRIDFPAVRASMKPVMTAEVERTIARALKDAGPLGALLGNQVRGDLAGQLVASAIDSIVTPVNIIKIAHDRKSIREATEQATAEQIGGGLGGMLGGDIGGRGGVLEKSGKPRQGQGGDQSLVH